MYRPPRNWFRTTSIPRPQVPVTPQESPAPVPAPTPAPAPTPTPRPEPQPPVAQPPPVRQEAPTPTQPTPIRAAAAPPSPAAPAPTAAPPAPTPTQPMPIRAAVAPTPVAAPPAPTPAVAPPSRAPLIAPTAPTPAAAPPPRAPIAAPPAPTPAVAPPPRAPVAAPPAPTPTTAPPAQTPRPLIAVGQQAPTPGPAAGPAAAPVPAAALPPPAPRPVSAAAQPASTVPVETEYQKNVLVQKTVERPPQEDVAKLHKPGKNGTIEVSREARKKLSDSDLEKGTRIITIAGENRGASMEILRSQAESTQGSRYLYKEGKTEKAEEKISPKDNNLKAKEMNTKPMRAFVNSNVQGVNSSILFHSSFTHHDPGVHLAFSGKPRRHEGKVKDQAASSQAS